jgi:hypothetical protein
MEKHATVSPPLRTRITTGLALDAGMLAALYTLLAAAGPFAPGWTEWLVALPLSATPWCVHVGTLPTVFAGSSPDWGQAASLFTRGLAFTMLVALGFPLLESVGFSIVVITFLVVAGAEWLSATSMTWYAQALGYVTILVITAPVSAAVGALLYGRRPTGTQAQPNSGGSSDCVQTPSLLTDILGGTSAAVIAVGGFYPTTLLSHPAMVYRHQELTFGLIAVPQALPFAVVESIALLPHLIMTGTASRLTPDVRATHDASLQQGHPSP